MAEALLMTMMDPAPGGEAEFNDWANLEHLPERRRMAGFHTALRFQNKSGSPRYLALYDLEDIAVLRSAAYLGISGENLSPWSKRVVAGATARWRFSGSRTGPVADGPMLTGGVGAVAELLLVRWRDVLDACAERIASAFCEAVAGSPGVIQWRVFAGEDGGGLDYVGIAESALPFGVDVTEPRRYGAVQSCDFAHVFVPLAEAVS